MPDGTSGEMLDGVIDGMSGEAERIAAQLGLEPLPDEGGRFRRMHLDGHSSAIYYLLVAPEFSALHRLAATEIYHWHAGAPLRLLVLHPDGRIGEPVLGPDLAAGQRPQVVVPSGVWQGSSPDGRAWQGSDRDRAFTLVGTTMAPPFDRTGFELGVRTELIIRYPAARARIEELTRPPG